MKLLDLIEKFVDQTPEVDGEQATARSFPGRGQKWSSKERLDVLDGLQLFMEQRGWKILGTGYFASVFESPKVPGMVLKLMPRRDQGYMRFYSMAKRSDNPHFPVVSRLGVMNVPDPMYAVLLEKLEPKDYSRVDYIVSPMKDFFRGDIDQLPNYISREYPELEKALAMARSLLRGNKGYNDDLHSSNIMWRGNVPVITDPILKF
jgi:hypothetical protein